MSRAESAEPRQWLERFGLKAFRPGQEQVISAVLAGKDVLCVMPTGGGKSLCYQLPALALKGLTIVVSPLIALMQDQVGALERRGIRAALINSTLTAGEQANRMEKMARGEYELVYVAPERLRNGQFLDSIQQTKVALLAVDEAHCVSEWGHDFRPDYSRLGRFRLRYLNGVQTIALTATATPTVRRDICDSLQLNSPQEFVTGFARPNLRLSVDNCNGDGDKDRQLMNFLAKQDGAGIIYAATRKKCEELSERLSQQTRKRFGVYHAGLPQDQRRSMQDRFMSGELAAIVATNAFGMGVDKSDLRYVVHYNMPGSLEAYYQEAGRAGRDGLPSECRLLFSYSDRYIQEFFIENAYPTAAAVQSVYEFLCEQEVDPIEMTLDEIREGLRIKDLTSEAVGTAESLLARTGVLERLDAGAGNAVLRIDSDLETLVDLLPREAKVRRKVLRAAERLVGKRRHEDVYVPLPRIIRTAELDREQVTRSLRELSRLKAFDYIPPFRGRAVHLRQRNVSFADLKIDFEELDRRKTAEYEKLNAVIKMAQSATCRQLTILRYFGDPEAAHCGNCDRCGNRGPGEKPKPVATGVDAEMVAKGVRIALSGIARMHGRFGKLAIGQMLCGSQNRKLQQWKVNRLSTFGLLAGLQQKQVNDLLDAIISAGLARQEEIDQRRPVLHLSDEGREVMNGTIPLPGGFRLSPTLSRQLAACAAKIPSSENTAGAKTCEDDRVCTEPAKCDETVDSSKLAAIPQAPIMSGKDNLATILEQETATETIVDSSIEELRDDAYWSWRLISDGYQAKDCCKIRRISQNTFLDHLIKAASRGQAIQLEWFLSADDARLIAKVTAAGEEASSRLKALLPNHISPKLFELARAAQYVTCRESVG